MTAIQKSVYISGLPSTFTEQDLRKAFQDIGGVESCLIVRTVVGTSSGTAYVQFDEVTKATNAVKKVTEEKVMKATMVPEDRHDEFNLLMTPKSTTRREDSTVQPSTVIVQETPKVTVFSGSPGKDCSFGRWRYEVECMINSKTYNQQTILHAVRKSLRSPAAELITHLDSDATLDELLSKLESIYGSVLSGQTLLQRFYSETQKQDESCAEWACRLEDIAYQAQKKMSLADVKTLLVNQFWTGLSDHRIKEALRHQRGGTSFQAFVIQARELEEEFQDKTTTAVKGRIKPQVNKPTEIELLSSLVQKMDSRMSKMEEQMKNLAGMQPQQHHVNYASYPGNQQANGTIVGCHKCGQDNHLPFGCRQGTSVICYQCGMVGHISRSCKAQSASLNPTGPQ